MAIRASSINHRVGPEAAEAPAILKPVWIRLLDRAIELYLVVWLFIATGAILGLLVSSGSDLSEFSDDERGILSLLRRWPVVMIAPFLIMSRAKAVTALVLRNPALLLLLLWIWCSVLWSVTPEISMRRAFMLTLSTLLACYLVIRHDLDWILEKVVWLYLALLLVSVVFVIFLPSLSKWPGGQGLQVIFTHKNKMGYFLLTVVILLPPAIRRGVVHPSLGLAGLLIALGLLVPVKSATAIAAAFLVLATYAAIAVWRLPTRLAATVTAFGIAMAFVLIVPFLDNPNLILDLLNRDKTWWGRIRIWQFVWQWIQERPLIGYGYGAFFEIEEIKAYVAAAFPWEPGGAHNGYVELLLAIGLVGLTSFMLFIGSGPIRIMFGSNRPDPSIILLLLPLLVGYSVHAITESTLLEYGSIDWVLVVVFTVSTTPNLAAIRRL